MSDFKRCPGNSLFCLEFDCCGMQNLLNEQGTEANTSDSDFASPVKKKRLSLFKGSDVRYYNFHNDTISIQ